MKKQFYTGFEPAFRDDIFRSEILTFEPEYLRFPVNPDSLFWPKFIPISEESGFDEDLEFEKPQLRARMLRPADSGKMQEMVLPEELPHLSDEVLNFMFPPAVWFADSAEERSRLLTISEQASGDILLAGLGFGIFAQLLQIGKRPVRSLTILEKNADLVRLYQKYSPDFIRNSPFPIRIICSDATEFISETSEKYDTVCWNLYQNPDYKQLPFANNLIAQSSKILKVGGQIFYKAYAEMADDFVALAQNIRHQPESDFKVSESENPLLFAYFRFREKYAQTDQSGFEKALRQEALALRSSQIFISAKEHQSDPYYDL